jgi:hypothetical protein
MLQMLLEQHLNPFRLNEVCLSLNKILEPCIHLKIERHEVHINRLVKNNLILSREISLNILIIKSHSLFSLTIPLINEILFKHTFYK